MLGNIPGPLLNSIEIIRWNSNKKYLLDLQNVGVTIVPTNIIQTMSELSALQMQWSHTVVKPTVSASSYLTYLLNQIELTTARPLLEKIFAHSELMIQPFIPEIQNSGEVSLIYFKITQQPYYSHAVLKTAKSGEFRIQSEFGGSVHSYEPTSEEKLLGQRILAHVKQDWVYARVDLIQSQNGLLLCELEMIEPELFLSFSPESAELFYRAIIEHLTL